MKGIATVGRACVPPQGGKAGQGRPGGWRVQVVGVGGGIGKVGRVGACLALKDLVEFGFYSTYNQESLKALSGGVI